MGGPKWMSLSYWKGNKTADTNETKQATHYPCGCANKKGLLAPKAGFNINAAWSCDIIHISSNLPFHLDFWGFPAQVALSEFSIKPDEKCTGPAVHLSQTEGKYCSCDKGKAANWDVALGEDGWVGVGNPKSDRFRVEKHIQSEVQIQLIHVETFWFQGPKGSGWCGVSNGQRNDGDHQCAPGDWRDFIECQSDTQVFSLDRCCSKAPDEFWQNFPQEELGMIVDSSSMKKLKPKVTSFPRKEGEGLWVCCCQSHAAGKCRRGLSASHGKQANVSRMMQQDAEWDWKFLVIFTRGLTDEEIMIPCASRLIDRIKIW